MTDSAQVVINHRLDRLCVHGKTKEYCSDKGCSNKTIPDDMALYSQISSFFSYHQRKIPLIVIETPDQTISRKKRDFETLSPTQDDFIKSLSLEIQVQEDVDYKNLSGWMMSRSSAVQTQLDRGIYKLRKAKASFIGPVLHCFKPNGVPVLRMKCGHILPPLTNELPAIFICLQRKN